MSKLLITKYHNQLHEILNAGGTRNETSISFAFAALLRSYAEKKGLLLVEQKDVVGRSDKRVIPDGTLKYFGGIDVGYWEAKDSKDKLDYEIDKKLNQDGYPNKNIIFEDTNTAVLIQEGNEVMRVPMREWNLLDDLLDKFVDYQPSEVKEFSKALEQFKENVPDIVKGLRELIEVEAETNENFREMRDLFLEIARSEINPEITPEDVREMIIQHILTEDIFTNVFDDADFHRSNNIARELENVIETFMTREVRKNYLRQIENFYKTIRDAASGITDNHEKQKFLKTVYENFYKVYNPKGADKLGVVYTPNEIVRFMIDSTDWLLEKHFAKSLSDKGVDILDPATGTGTFIAELIDRINIHNLEYKYEHELHANEVAILPYYIANLNIEYTYQQRKDTYKEFKNICFVDTLDNTDALAYSGKQPLLGGISSENAKRIKDQNAKRISVIIGNPPYNANQKNFNDFNANRKYLQIDKRIKNTYIEYSTAQKTKAYDMYSRFIRWASDRIDKNGIVAFISNNSFINSKTLDGLRKCLADEFNEVWVIDLKGNANTSGERRRKEAGNVFNDKIKVGVAVYFLIKNEKLSGSKIYYNAINDYVKAFEKSDYLRSNNFNDLKFERIEPDKNNNWINLAEEGSDFDDLLPLIDKNVKSGKNQNAVFTFYSLGAITARDEWVYDFSADSLFAKVNHFIDAYERKRKEFSALPEKERKQLEKDRGELNQYLGTEIKFNRELITRDFLKNKEILFSWAKIIPCNYRPYIKKFNYYDSEHRITHEPYKNGLLFGKYGSNENKVIALNAGSITFDTLGSNRLVDFAFLKFANGSTQCLPLHYYAFDARYDNITDWGLEQFQTQYSNLKITKQDIFYYTYGVLHSPQYRKKYEQNLKREFPRLPFYEDFAQWRDWGKELMDLHINYETQKPFALGRKDLDLTPKQKNKQNNFFADLDEIEKETFIAKPRTKLRADKVNGTIEIDSHTTLTGVPALAWEYKLGNRSALEWVLDQYKEKKPQDATIAERFNTYKFEDYKEQVIDLLKRVCNVSVKTMQIVNQMPNADYAGRI